MLSRALLIARVAFFFFQRFSSEPRGQPGSTVGDASHPVAFWLGLSFWPLRALPAVYVSAVIDGGSHPFPFRTRKLSLLSPMVLGLRARESRSLQDSRGPLPTRQGASSFLYEAVRPIRKNDAMVRPHSRRHGKLTLAACGSRPLL